MEFANTQQNKEKAAKIKHKPGVRGSTLRKCASNRRGATGSGRNQDNGLTEGLLQRTCSCGNHTIAGGQCSACRQNRKGASQTSSFNDPSLKIGQSDSLAQSTRDSAQSTRDSAFDWDFSRVPARATMQMMADDKPGELPGEQADSGGLAGEVETIATEKMEKLAPEPLIHDFGTWQIRPMRAVAAKRASPIDVPASGTAPDDEFIDLPRSMSNLRGIIRPAVQLEDGDCEQPLSMHKVTSGAFVGGMTMDSYYPDLAGHGYYSHPGTGGTFDTGSRAGANVQLYGVIPSACEPGSFTLEQTVSRTRYRHNGRVHEREGQFADDIAKSGRDGTTAPFRQEFLGGDGAPEGYIISMADPPSTAYAGNIDIEHDREFVTSLVGPGGRRSVEWALSTRIEDGAVTDNTLT